MIAYFGVILSIAAGSTMTVWLIRNVAEKRRRLCAVTVAVEGVRYP